MRLSWSPDGGYLSTTQGFNAGQPTALVLKRGDWTTMADFVGHKQPITCTKFCSRIFRRNGSEPYFICAVGSQDACISIWSTGMGRPILVAKDLFTQSIQDLSWSRDGYTLVANSSDGSVVVLHFSPKELGEVISEHEASQMIKKHYGDIMNLPTSVTLAETPDILNLEKKAPNEAIIPTKSLANGTGVSGPSPILTKGPVRQIEMKLSDGRKRITPQYLGGSSAVSPTMQVSPTSSLFTSDNSNGQSSMRERPTPIVTTPSTPLGSSFASPPSVPKSTHPVQVSISSTPVQPSGETPKEKRKNPPNEEEAASKKAKIAEVDDKSKEKDKKEEEQKKKEKKKDKEKEKEREEKEKSKEKKEKPKEKKEKRKGGSEGPRAPPVPRLVTPVALPKLLYSITIKGQSSVSIEATIIETQGDPISSIVCMQNDKILWEERVKSKVLLITGNAKFSAVGCEDGSLHIFSPSGRHLFPPIHLGDTIASLECSKTDHLLAMSCSCLLYVWDITKQKCNLNTSVSHLLSVQKEITIRRTRITEEGLPIITLTTFQSFTYNESMKTWFCVADDRYIHSEYSSMHVWQTESMGVLSELQSLAFQNIKPTPLLSFSATPQVKTVETISHLENQLASAIALQSSKEYVHWLNVYVRRLSNDANESKLHEICSSLLGPPYKHSSESLKKSNWDPIVLGLPKRELLQNLLPLISANRALQRLVTQYTEGLKNVS